MEEKKVCSNCKSDIDSSEKFCNNCGFPENGDEKEKTKFNFGIKLKKEALADANKKLKQVRILLYVLAGLNLVMGLFWILNEETFFDAIGSFFGAVVFFICAFWVKKQPLTGVLAAFIFWLVVQSLVIFIDPALLLKGIIWKVLIVGFFIKGIQSAKDVKEFTEKLNRNNHTS